MSSCKFYYCQVQDIEEELQKRKAEAKKRKEAEQVLYLNEIIVCATYYSLGAYKKLQFTVIAHTSVID